MPQPDVMKLKTEGDIEGLIQTLTYHDLNRDFGYDVAGNAARALGEIGDTRAFEPLIAALKRKNSMLKKEIQDNDGNYYTETFVDYEAVVRERSAEALGRIGDNRAVEPLIEALQDKKANVRKAVAVALGQLKDKRAVKPFIEIFSKGIKNSSDMDEYRSLKEIARALGMIGDKKAVAPLIHWLDTHKGEPGYDVGMIAEGVIWALGRLGDDQAIGPIENCLDWKAEKWTEIAMEAINNLEEVQKEPTFQPAKWIKGLFRK